MGSLCNWQDYLYLIQSCWFCWPLNADSFSVFVFLQTLRVGRVSECFMCVFFSVFAGVGLLIRETRVLFFFLLGASSRLSHGSVIFAHSCLDSFLRRRRFSSLSSAILVLVSFLGFSSPQITAFVFQVCRCASRLDP